MLRPCLLFFWDTVFSNSPLTTRILSPIFEFAVRTSCRFSFSSLFSIRMYLVCSRTKRKVGTCCCCSPYIRRLSCSIGTVSSSPLLHSGIKSAFHTAGLSSGSLRMMMFSRAVMWERDKRLGVLGTSPTMENGEYNINIYEVHVYLCFIDWPGCGDAGRKCDQLVFSPRHPRSQGIPIQAFLRFGRRFNARCYLGFGHIFAHISLLLLLPPAALQGALPGGPLGVARLRRATDAGPLNTSLVRTAEFSSEAGGRNVFLLIWDFSIIVLLTISLA